MRKKHLLSSSVEDTSRLLAKPRASSELLLSESAFSKATPNINSFQLSAGERLWVQDSRSLTRGYFDGQSASQLLECVSLVLDRCRPWYMCAQEEFDEQHCFGNCMFSHHKTFGSWRTREWVVD
jgi:hypothetical protein